MIKVMAQVKSFEDAKPQDDSTPQNGLVKNVCRKWLVHEDEGLAHRLQEAEFQTHFGRNKQEHHTIQGDIKVAKKEQNMELAEIERRHAEHVSQLKRLELCDYELAERLQQAILDEELMMTEKNRQRDEKLAVQLQEEEKRRLQTERQRAPPAQQLVYARSPEIRFPDRSHPEISPQISRTFEDTPTPPVSRQTSHEVKSSHAVRMEEKRRLQELQDEELAIKLQALEQEASYDDHRMAVEAQDAEYARLLQEKEKERLKKLKEKSRLQKELSNPERSQNDDEFPPVAAARYYPSTQEQKSPTAELNGRLSNMSLSSRTQSVDYDPRTRPQVPSTQRGTINVAKLIDPTYKADPEVGVSPDYGASQQSTSRSSSVRNNHSNAQPKNMIPRSQK